MECDWFVRLLRAGGIGSVLALLLGILAPLRADTASVTSAAASRAPLAVSKRSQADAPQSWVIPFAYDPPGRPLLTVQVRIDQSAPLLFLVDTGADSILIFPWAARQLDLKPTGATIPSRSGKSVASVLPPCDLEFVAAPNRPTLTFHADQLLMADIPPLEAYPGPHVAGVIGGSLFQKMASRFDFAQRTLTLFSKGAPLPAPAGPSTTLPLFKEITRDRSAVVLALPGAPITTFILDTGSDTSSLPATVGANVAALATGSTWFQNMDGGQPVSTLLLGELPLGNLSTELVELGLRPDQNHGLLGLNVLTRFLVTLDPFHGALILEPRPGYRSRLSGHVGTLEEHNGVFTVVGVEDTAAKRSGVRVGDRILAIDGEPAKSMNAMEVELKFNGYEGAETLLELESPEGQHHTVRLKPRSRFHTVVRCELGMLLSQDKGQNARVLEVQPNSEAARVGIQKGDEVIAVNRMPTTDLTISEFLHALGEDTAGMSPLKTLTIRHASDGRVLVLPYEAGKLQGAQR